jgi:hypothetical protein
MNNQRKPVVENEFFIRDINVVGVNNTALAESNVA